MTHEDILQVEFYDQLTPTERLAFRENTAWDEFVDDPDAVEAEFDRIDNGYKAMSLS